MIEPDFRPGTFDVDLHRRIMLAYYEAFYHGAKPHILWLGPEEMKGLPTPSTGIKGEKYFGMEIRPMQCHGVVVTGRGFEA